MANSLMNFFGSSGGGGNILFQAFGAMLRGESPQAFMQNLARTNPALRGLDLTDINATAQKVCREHGVDAEKLAGDIKQRFDNYK